MADDDLYGNVVNSMMAAYEKAWEAYKLLTWDRDRRKEYENDFPIAHEVARACLPFSVYYWGVCSGNVLAWLHFLSKRIHDPACARETFPQLEIQEAAQQVEEIFRGHWPLVHKAFVENGRAAP